MQLRYESQDDLGYLADPACCTDKLSIDGCAPEVLKRQLRMMLLIRRLEEQVGVGVTSGKIACPCHLGIGQEAIAVGISEHLRKTDRAFGTHRSHAQYLAMGATPYSLLAEILGKADGCSRGIGGSMHLQAMEHGFVGSVPIVAGTIPLAVGAAIAAQKDGRGDIAIAFFGDGASEEGVLHECLNLAAVMKAPALFVCENNLFSSHLHIGLRQSSNRVSRFADAHGVPSRVIDGNDIVAVSATARELISAMRAGEGPAFLETITYRWRGHVGPSEDIDVGVNRDKDLVRWKARDPVRRLFEGLESAALITKEEFDHMDEAVVAEIDEAWARAETAAYPAESALLELVYSQGA